MLLVATTRENVSPSLVLELLRRVGGIIKARAAGTAACGRLGARERRAIRTRKRAQRGGAVRSCLGACERRAPRARRGACTGVQDCGAMCCPACEAAQLVRLSLGCSALTQPGASDALPGRQAHSKQQGEPCARLRRVVPMRRRSRASSLCRSSSRTGLPGSGRGGTVYAIQRACPEPCQVALRGLPREARAGATARRGGASGLLRAAERGGGAQERRAAVRGAGRGHRLWLPAEQQLGRAARVRAQRAHRPALCGAPRPSAWARALGAGRELLARVRNVPTLPRCGLWGPRCHALSSACTQPSDRRRPLCRHVTASALATPPPPCRPARH